MASATVGQIGLDLILQKKKFNQQLKDIKTDAKNVGKEFKSTFKNFFGDTEKSADKSAKNISKSFDSGFNGITGLAKKAGAAIAAALAVGKIVDFGKECIELGSDLSEVQNVVDVTFTQMRQQVNEFAQSAAKNFGLSETMAKRYTGTLGAMAKAFGFTEQEAATMSMTLTGLAGDVASFYNISQDEAFTKLKSVFTGETESLKDLGIVMTQTALDEFALSQGISKTTSDMTESEKVALRYKFVLQQLGTASGDFARTSDGWANQMRILNLQFDSFKANIGQGLINVLTPAVKAINTLMEKLVQLSAKFKEFTELITGKTSDSSGTGSTASDLAGIKDSADDVKDSAKKAKEEIRSLMGFDQINKLSDTEEEKDAGIDIGSGLGNAAGQADKTGSAIDKLKDKLKSLFDLFKKGFDLGFADADLENLLRQARRVKDALEAIFTDPRVVNAAKRLGNQIVETLGVITGSIARVAVEWGAAILAGIADSLEKNREYIVSKLTEILNTTTEIVDQIGRIFLTLADILTAPQVLESLRGLSESITTFLVTATLSVTDIATKYGLAIITGIADSLEENKESISDKLSKILDNCSQFFDDLSSLFDSLDYIFTAPEALESLRQLSSDITTILTDLTLTALDIVTGFGTDLMELIITPIVDNKERLREAFNGILEVISSVIGTIKEVVTNTCEKITELYDEHIKPFMDSLKDGISEIVGTLLDGYNEYIAPVLEELAAKFEDVMRNHVQPMIDSGIELLGEIVDCIKELWKNWIQPFINWCAEKIAPILAPIMKTVGSAFMDNLSDACDALKTVWDVAKKVVEFFKCIFAKDIKGAFDIIKNAAKDAFTSIVNTITSKINTAINAINSLIDGFNAIDIPDNVPILGGIGNIPHIPNIPALAEGGYVKANTPRLAVIGDNTRYGEIVAPEDKLLEMAKMAAQMSGGGNNAELLIILKEILNFLKTHEIVEIDPEALRKWFIKKTNQNTMATGNPELITY